LQGCRDEIIEIAKLFDEIKHDKVNSNIKQALEAIYNSPGKEISMKSYQTVVGNEWKLYLKRNVFSYHPNKDIITFQSKVVENYVQEEVLKK